MILLSASPQPGEKTHTICPKSPHDERSIAYSFQLFKQEKEKIAHGAFTETGGDEWHRQSGADGKSAKLMSAKPAWAMLTTENRGTARLPGRSW
jgi:hypothetical protein